MQKAVRKARTKEQDIYKKYLYQFLEIVQAARKYNIEFFIEESKEGLMLRLSYQMCNEYTSTTHNFSYNLEKSFPNAKESEKALKECRLFIKTAIEAQNKEE